MMTLMTAGRKICSMIDMDPNEVMDLSFTEHDWHGRHFVGILLKSRTDTVVVPDIRNAEKLFIFSTTSINEIIPHLLEHGYAQKRVADMLKVSQSTISRILNLQEDVKC